MTATACSTEYRSKPSTVATLRPLSSDDELDPCNHARDNALDEALDLIAIDRPVEADELLTAALLEAPGREELWLAAGIARLRRGATRSAAAAFRMACWIGDDPLARELVSAIEG
jgi:hypothetical protein